ncbi:membrane protein STY1534 [Myroides odoratimimus]|nr:membrane protein STY1534 [Myroides odoratimimus]
MVTKIRKIRSNFISFNELIFMFILFISSLLKLREFIIGKVSYIVKFRLVQYIYYGSKRKKIMILCDKKDLVLRKTIPILLIIFSLSWLVYFMGYFFPKVVLPLNVEIFSFVGISLAIFLGFCNNAAYDRFKEGNKQLANLMSHSRSLTFQILNLIKEDSNFTIQDKRNGVNIIVAFCYTLNIELKNKNNWNDLTPLIAEDIYNNLRQKEFKSAYLLNELTNWTNEQFINGRIDFIIRARMNHNIEELSKVLGACERIVDTKIPFVYFVLLHRTIYIFCFLLPFGLLGSMSWFMPFFVFFISYTFISLDAVVAEIAEPFKDRKSDLLLDQICNDISSSLNEISKILPQ